MMSRFGRFEHAPCYCARLPSLPAGSVVNAAPLRLASGEPWVCIYYFPHWWEPWKSSDEAVLRDLRGSAPRVSTRSCWITSGVRPSMATGDSWTARTGWLLRQA